MDKLTQLIHRVVEEEGYFVYAITLGPKDGEKTLVVDIEGVGYLGIDDVVKVNQALSLALDDQEDLIAGSYRLEVGSADPERELHTLDQMKRAVGRWVVVTTHEQSIEGGLDSVTRDTIQVTTKKKKQHTIHHADITMLRLAIHF